jgi:RecA-family ATPase
MGSVVLFSAAAKVGKTTALQNLALALTAGERSFLGFNLPGYRRSVLYLNADEDPRIFGPQVKMLGVPERLRILDLVPGKFDVSQPAHIDALAEECRQHDVGVVIIDVWSSVFSGEESSNSEVIRG